MLRDLSKVAQLVRAGPAFRLGLGVQSSGDEQSASVQRQAKEVGMRWQKLGRKGPEMPPGWGDPSCLHGGDELGLRGQGHFSASCLRREVRKGGFERLLGGLWVRACPPAVWGYALGSGRGAWPSSAYWLWQEPVGPSQLRLHLGGSTGPGRVLVPPEPHPAACRGTWCGCSTQSRRSS